MMQLSTVRYLALLIWLSLLLGFEAAALPKQSEKADQLVRVYSINEEQYERMLQLTQGKNVISEARLINGGFATVSESLSSGWHSLLRVVGLTTISRSNEESKIDFENQPLCVIKTREDEDGSMQRSSGRDIEGIEDEQEEAINCIVVLKKQLEQELPSVDTNEHFASYWYSTERPQIEPTEVVATPPKVIKVMQKMPEQKEEVITSPAVVKTSPKSKKVSQMPKKNRTRLPNFATNVNEVPSSRQYGSPYGLPQYGSPSPFGYGAGGYSPYGSPYGPSPYGPYGQQSYGQQFPYYPQQYYGRPPAFPYGPYSHFDQSSGGAVLGTDDDDDDDDSGEVTATYELGVDEDEDDWRSNH